MLINSDYNTSGSRSLTDLILCEEYNDSIISCLSASSTTLNVSRCLQRQQLRQDVAQNAINDIRSIQVNWPSVVSDNVVFRCLANYQEHTIWRPGPPQVCCVCRLKHEHIIEITISSDSNCLYDFTILHAKDSFITDLMEFQYRSNIINNIVSWTKTVSNSMMTMESLFKYVLNVCLL